LTCRQNTIGIIVFILAGLLVIAAAALIGSRSISYAGLAVFFLVLSGWMLLIYRNSR
jgi:uncharacterized oligopeptide transporter (OPT) family protein